MRFNSLLAVVVVAVLSLGCLREPAGREVVVSASPVDGRLLRCLHQQDSRLKDGCMMFLAAGEKDTSHCSRIVGDRMRGVCMSALSGNASVCMNALNHTPDAAAYCLAVYTKNETQCLNIGDTTLRGECVTLLSFIEYDKVNCGVLADEGLKSKCILEFALNYGDRLLCKVIPDIRSRDDCYMGYAISEVKPDFCDKIGDQSKTVLCREMVEVRKLAPADCLEFEDEVKRAWCINEVAYDRIDESLCALHLEFTDRLVCEARVRAVD